jgi:hypothetical protein
MMIVTTSMVVSIGRFISASTSIGTTHQFLNKKNPLALIRFRTSRPGNGDRSGWLQMNAAGSTGIIDPAGVAELPARPL